jgi:predicted aspartyl protease
MLPRMHLLSLARIILAGVLVAACRGPGDGAPAAPLPSPLAEGRAPAGPFERTLGFNLVQNAIVVPARLNGADHDDELIVDSGAPLTLSEAVVHRLGLPTVAHVDIAGPESGGRSVPVMRVDRIDIAGIAFEGIGGVVAWVEPPSPLACLSRSGLLGASLLKTAIWQIDFVAREMTVTDDVARLDHVTNAERIPFTRSDVAGSPRIAARINATRDASLLVDLGFNGSLAIPADLYERTGNATTADMPRGSGASSATVLGQHAASSRIGRLGELQIGSLFLEDFPVVTGDAVSDFHVGVDFLRHFIVTLDWKNDDLYLERRVPPAALYPHFASYGFVPSMQGDELVVGFLWSQSAAARAGMRLGDRLEAIDGQDVTQPAFETFCEILATIGLFGHRTGPIEVVGRRGDERHRWQVHRSSLLTGPENHLPR